MKTMFSAGIISASLLLIMLIMSTGRAAVPNPTMATPRTQATQQGEAVLETFTGEVSRKPNGKNHDATYVLYDETRKMNFFLLDDGQQMAPYKGNYKGKKFEITGTLDRPNNTIRVKSVKVRS